jgi:hypothetical protein
MISPSADRSDAWSERTRNGLPNLRGAPAHGAGRGVQATASAAGNDRYVRKRDMAHTGST